MVTIKNKNKRFGNNYKVLTMNIIMNYVVEV